MRRTPGDFAASRQAFLTTINRCPSNRSSMIDARLIRCEPLRARARRPMRPLSRRRSAPQR
ncbi:hypothetical protein A8H31_07750 [Burkholderia thailandensis]|nr:hypothetical protein A8H31_07750 [Burkholderia thailandensis]NOK45415.1 hypothetical protein [Burkholderia thailandensis]NOK56765.1 hypothetical protein [Burkholderia thailandensis]PNE70971.1 hypothetical protein A8H38_01375 [Burkholderia thailandensis]PNE82865.1 hypothetical protein A8H34_00820 [Burkholderia thailandensis]